jgi:hypothetical protein
LEMPHVHDLCKSGVVSIKPAVVSKSQTTHLLNASDSLKRSIREPIVRFKHENDVHYVVAILAVWLAVTSGKEAGLRGVSAAEGKRQ